MKLRRGSVLGLLLASAITSVGALSHADSGVGTDEVTLKSGVTIRCTVVSVEPGTRVVIHEQGKSEPRVLPWSEVGDIQKGKFAAIDQSKMEPGPEGPGYEDEPEPSGDDDDDYEDEDDDSSINDSRVQKGATRIEDSALRPGMSIVQVHIETTEPTSSVFLVEDQNDAVVCELPCDKLVDSRFGREFRISGDAMPDSRVFNLVSYVGAATIRVEPGNSTARGAGIVLISLGAVLAVGGATGLAISGPLLDGDVAGYAIGGVALGVGLGGLAAGIALLIGSDTDIKIKENQPDLPRDPNGSYAPPVPSGDDIAERFAIDDRPPSVGPQYWRGEL